jgi:hypothetical protein
LDQLLIPVSYAGIIRIRFMGSLLYSGDSQASTASPKGYFKYRRALKTLSI